MEEITGKYVFFGFSTNGIFILMIHGHERKLNFLVSDFFFLCWENFYLKTSLSVIFFFVGKISIIKISSLCYLFFLIIFQGFKTEKCLTPPFTLEVSIKSMWVKVFLVKESSSLQALSRVQTFATPWTAARPASLSINNSRSLSKLMPVESVMPSNHLIICHPLFLLPSILPSIRVFSSKSVLCIRWPKYWNFSFNISPSNEHSGLLSFRMDWFVFLLVQGTLKSFLQHHSSKASILWCSTFFIAQLSHPYMTTGKTIALTRWTFFSKVMSLLFNMLSRLVIAFLPRSKYTVHGILQARILEWVTISFSRESSQPRSQTQVSGIAGWFFTSWFTREAWEKSWLLRNCY